MPYRNKNERQVPEPDKKIAPDVVANPVDTTIKYQVNPLDNAKRQARYDTLALIGQGLISVDKNLQADAAEKAFELHQETEGKTNKEDWAKASKNITGMAKYNPYIKDEYKKLVAQDIQREAELELLSNPNDYTLSVKDFEQRLQDIRKTAYFKYENLGIDVRQYKPYAEKLETSLQKARQIYTEKNAAYNYKNTLNQLSYSFSSDCAAAVLSAADENSKIEAFNNCFNNFDVKCEELGIPANDRASAAIAGISSFIVDNPDLMDEESYIKAALNLKLDNKDMGELMPDYTKKIKELVDTAQDNYYKKLKRKRDIYQLEQQNSKEQASTDYMAAWLANPKMDSLSKMQLVQELNKKYNLNGDYQISMYQQVQGLDNTIEKIYDIEDDPRALHTLLNDYINETLTTDKVLDFYNQGLLTDKTALSYGDKVLSRIKAEEKKPNTSKYTMTNAIELSKLIAKDIDPDNFENPLTIEQKKQLANQVTDTVKKMRGGLISTEEGTLYLNQLNELIEYASKKGTKAASVADLMNLNYLKDLPVALENEETLIENFTKFGMFRNDKGKSYAPLTSAPSNNRTIGGTTRVHRGIDFGAENINGIPIDGTIVLAGSDETGGAGNYAIVRYGGGKNVFYLKYLHLKDKQHVGRTVARNVFWTKAGKTGNATGTCVHVEAFDDKFKPINSKKVRDLINANLTLWKI